jgi:hypothetical protein
LDYFNSFTNSKDIGVKASKKMSKNTAFSKSLKGGIVSSSSGFFDTLTANNIVLSDLAVEGLISGTVLSNVQIINSQIDNTIIGANGINQTFFTTITSYGDVTFYNVDKTKNLSWNSNTGVLTLNGGDFSVSGCSLLGNLQICVNTIQAVNTNGDVIVKPNGIGTLFLSGPINNTTSSGNFLSRIDNGNFNVIANQNVSLLSSNSYFSASSFSDQTLTTINGDIKLVTETGIGTKLISNILATSGNIQVITVQNSNFRVGDSVTITGSNTIPPLDGIFTISAVNSTNSFNISTATALVTGSTTGTVSKSPTNDIYLTAGRYVKIPSNIPLNFGSTGVNITGNTAGLFLTSSSDLSLVVSSGNRIFIPQNVNVQFGTSAGNYLNLSSSGNTLNIVSADTIAVTSSLFQVYSTNTRFYDPILTIGDYTTGVSDLKDRGIEYRYSDTSGNMKLGWFGYKKSTGNLTFIPDATNTSEVISGAIGNLDIGILTLNNLVVNSGGNLDLNCGSLLRVSKITGCSGTVNIDASANVNISTGNLSILATQVTLPDQTPFNLGGNTIRSSGGDLLLTAAKSLVLSPSAGAINIPIGTKINLDGSTAGKLAIFGTTNGSLNLLATNGSLNLSAGNVNLPDNSNLNLGLSNLLVGNTGGITFSANSSSGKLIFNSVSDTTFSVGSTFLVKAGNDIDLYSSIGNVRVSSALVFGTSGTTNSIRTDSSGNLAIKGTAGKAVTIDSVDTINLSPISKIVIPTNIPLTLGSDSSILSSGGNLVLNNTLGSISLIAGSTAILNSSGNLSVVNLNTQVSTSNFLVNANTASFVVDNFRTKDPIVTIADYTGVDQFDRGIEYNYTSSAGSARMGFFGYKKSSDLFSFYESSINTSGVITGTLGQFQFAGGYLSGPLQFTGSTPGLVDLNCGTIANVNTITGCHGTIAITASDSTVVSSQNLFLNATSKILVPVGIPLAFGGTNNSISADSSGNLTISSGLKIILNSDVQINGTTSNVYSTVTNIQDPIISLGGVNGPTTSDGKDRGIEFKWYDTTTQTGFFGFKNTLKRFVYIPYGVNNSEVFSGPYGDVQFGGATLTGIDLQNGTIANLSTILGSTITLVASSGNLNLSSGNVNIPSTLNIAGTTNGISASNGSLIYKAQNNLIFTSSSGNISFLTDTSGSKKITFPDNTPIYIGPTSGSTFLLRDTTGNLNITNDNGTTGNINLNPYGNIIFPVNKSLVFGTTTNRIVSDGNQLLLYGYQSVGILSSNVSIGGNLNITGTLTASSLDLSSNLYIQPLGTNQVLGITNISNYTTGSVIVKTGSPSYLTAGDTITLRNTSSIPSINQTFSVSSVIDNQTVVIPVPGGVTVIGTSGSLSSNLTTDPGKDVGIQVNYYRDLLGNGITAGSVNYHTGFFGWKNTTDRWTFYDNATIANNLVSGNLGDIQANKGYFNRLSGFTLDGPVTASTYVVAGSNFQISGGQIDGAPIGQITPSTGRFTILTSSVSSNLANVTLNGSLSYSLERYTLNSSLVTRNPNVAVVLSFVSVTGVSFTGSGTMASSGIADGQLKIIVMSRVDDNCSYELNFPSGKLVTPGANTTPLPTKLTFKRKGMSAQMVWDNTAGFWVLTGSGAYAS